MAGIWRELPWLKVVVSMRDPISQKMSAIVHWGGERHSVVLNTYALGGAPFRPKPEWLASRPSCAELMSITPRPAALQTLELDRTQIPSRDCSELLFKNESSMYDCLLMAFNEHPHVSGQYHANLQTWLAASPPARFHVLQVSELTM